jgi:hypothetical protein
VLSAQEYDFAGPDAMALSGADLFVASDTVITEVGTATGSCLRAISGPPYGFNEADGILVDANELFVANAGDGSLTELPV